MIAEHAAAFLALLQADEHLTVFDGAPPDLTEAPYVVVWASLDSEDSLTLADEQGRANVRWTTHSVGASGQAARIVADRVRAAVHRQRLVIAGRQVWKVRHDFGIPPQPDESTGHLLVDAIDVWTAASYGEG